MSTTRERIMDEAERFLRTGGYHGFSFRDIATAVEVKSASVHHHFPTKEDLVLAVTERYHMRFMAALGDPDGAGRTPVARLRHYGGVFLTAFVESRRTCLCGMLSTESLHLPERVREVVRQTAQDNLQWIEKAVLLPAGKRSSKSTRARASVIYCAMEGAIHLAALRDDENVLKDVIASLAEREFADAK